MTSEATQLPADAGTAVESSLAESRGTNASSVGGEREPPVLPTAVVKVEPAIDHDEENEDGLADEMLAKSEMTGKEESTKEAVCDLNKSQDDDESVEVKNNKIISIPTEEPPITPVIPPDSNVLDVPTGTDISVIPKEEKIDEQEEAGESTEPSDLVVSKDSQPPPDPQPPPEPPATGTPEKSKDSRRVFQCSSCNTYYEDWNLFLHMRNVHNRFICLLCLGLFPNAKRLARHLLNKHGQKDNHFGSSPGDMLQWNGMDKPNSAGAQSAENVSSAPKEREPCSKDKLETPCGGLDQVTKKKSKSSKDHRPASETSQLSSDLVAASSGFKLKIKGLSSSAVAGQAKQAVRIEEAEKAVVESPKSAPSGDDNNNQDHQRGDDTGEVAAKGEPKPEGAFRLNFILSKKGLVRNPNPSKKATETNGETSHTHSQEDSGGGEGNSVDKEEPVRPLLVSKLKLKIPKYIVPVESEDESEEEEDDEDEESGDDGSGEESESKLGSQEVKKEAPEDVAGSGVSKDDSVASGAAASVKLEDQEAVDRDNSNEVAVKKESDGPGGELKKGENEL